MDVEPGKKILSSPKKVRLVRTPSTLKGDNRDMRYRVKKAITQSIDDLIFIMNCGVDKKLVEHTRIEIQRMLECVDVGVKIQGVNNVSESDNVLKKEIADEKDDLWDMFDND
jgi:hypothetical protein